MDKKILNENYYMITNKNKIKKRLRTTILKNNKETSTLIQDEQKN